MNKFAKLACKFEVRAIGEGSDGIVEGYASVFGVQDWYGSVFDKGAFYKTLNANKNIKVLFNHDDDEPIGRVIEAREDEVGLYVKYKLSLGVSKGMETYTLIKDGVLDSMSIGFWIRTEAIENNIWHIKEVDLQEVSVVTFPANDQAMITAFRAYDPRVEQRQNEINDGLVIDEIRKIELKCELQKLSLIASSVT